MSSNRADGSSPPLEVGLWLDASLMRACGPGQDCGSAVAGAVETAVGELLGEFGLPGSPIVVIDELAPQTARAQPILALSVAARRCSYPEALLSWVRSYVLAMPPDPDQNTESLLGWLRELAAAPASGAERSRLLEFFSLAARAILQRQPASVLGNAQLEAYLSSLPVPPEANGGPWPPDPAWVGPVLATALSLGISLANSTAVAAIVALARVDGLSPEETAEDLVVGLRPDVVELRLPRDYLKELTTAHGGDEDVFARLRGELERDLGVRSPPFRFVVDEQLKPRSCTVRVNHCMQLPFLGLRGDQCLVNESASQLRLMSDDSWQNGEPIATLEPSGGRYPFSIAPLSMLPRLEELGYQVWSPMEFLVISLKRILQTRGPALVDRNDVESRLAVAQMPTLVPAVTSRFSIATLTRLLRALVAEQIAIGDLKRILERLLDYDFRGLASTGYMILNDTPVAQGPPPADTHDDFAALLAFVRSGLRRQISAKYSRGTTTIVVYLLGREFEDQLAKRQTAHGDDPQLLRDDEHDKLVAAIRSEIAYLPPTAWVPAILTSSGARGALAEILAATLPDVAVVGHQELVPELNVQPVARISMVS